ncbi:MAG: hypothetical protein LUC41_09135 [Clostridiales bacterium]|nr:hypothetical protein [Clostridiales bacterium]
MGRIKALDEILDSMVQTGNDLIKAANELKSYFSTAPTQTDSPNESLEQGGAPEPALSYEEIRGILADKVSQEGGRYKAAVKDLIRKYSDTGNLSGISPEKYSTLVAELEVMENG